MVARFASGTPNQLPRVAPYWSSEVNKIILLISTTPSARAKVASQLFLCRAATPPRLRRGIFATLSLEAAGVDTMLADELPECAPVLMCGFRGARDIAVVEMQQSEDVVAFEILDDRCFGCAERLRGFVRLRNE